MVQILYAFRTVCGILVTLKCYSKAFKGFCPSWVNTENEMPLGGVPSSESSLNLELTVHTVGKFATGNQKSNCVNDDG